MKPIMAPCPRHIRRRYLTGKCDVLATCLAEEHGFELGAMRNQNGHIEHVFARHPASGMAIDIRGVMPVSEIPRGSALEDRPHVLDTTTRDEIAAAFGTCDLSDRVEAERVIRTYLAPVLEELDYDPAPGH